MMNYGYSEKGQQGSLSDFHLWKKILQFSAPYWIGLSLCRIHLHPDHRGHPHPSPSGPDRNR